MARARKTEAVLKTAGDNTNALLMEITRRELIMRRPDAVEKAERFRDQSFAFYRSCAESAGLARAREEAQGILPYVDDFGVRTLMKSERDDVLADGALATANAVQGLLDEYASKINDHRPSDGGATAYASIRPAHRDSVRVLFEKKRLDNAHLSAARDIAFVYEEASRLVMSKSQTFARGSGGGIYDRMSTQVADRHANCYVPWTRAMNESKSFDLPYLIDVIVFSVSIKAARTRYRIRHEKANVMLVQGLELYASYYATWRTRWAEMSA